MPDDARLFWVALALLIVAYAAVVIVAGGAFRQ